MTRRRASVAGGIARVVGRVLIALYGVLITGPAAAELPAADLWHIVDVVTPPWSTTPISAAAAALRGTGVAFLAGAIKGAAPLACSTGYVDERTIPWVSIFGGAIPGDRLDDMIAKLNLQGTNGAFVQHADCGGRTFDYYFGHDRRLLLFDGALVILRRPLDDTIEDVDDWVKPLRPGFDCAQARTTPEQLACSDYRLSVASRQLNERYAHLRATVSAASFATIQGAQRGWAPWAAVRCEVPADMPAEWTDRRDLALCLGAETEARTRLLGEQVVEAGPFRLEPRMRAIYQAAPPHEDTIVYPWLSGPAETADSFNRAIEDRVHRAVPFLTGDLIADPSSNAAMYARRDYTVSTATDRLISLTIVAVWDGGGAHGGLRSEAINFDLERRRVLTLDDVFRHDSAWQEAIVKLCIARLRDSGSDNPIFSSGVRSVVGNPAAWSFDSKSAHVFFDVYTIGSYSGGANEVVFPYQQLRRYLRADAPLP